MEQQRPPAYSRDPDTIILPSVPQGALPPPNGNISLPSINSLELLSADKDRSHRDHSSIRFPSVPTSLPTSRDTPRTSFSSLSADDRAAAEALSNLRSPQTRSNGLPAPDNVSDISVVEGTNPQSQEPEPLLQLLTNSHPWIGRTIDGSLSAYSTTKLYSPRIVRDSAEFIERNVGSPVASTVGVIGRQTGVESGLRRYLMHRRPSDLEAQVSPDTKRRKVDSDAMDIETDAHIHTTSVRARTDSQTSTVDSLPPYDTHRSPNYEENAMVITKERESPAPMNWSTQVVVSTSGLGIALRPESLKRLRYCLALLTNASQCVENTTRALKQVLADYEETLRSSQQSSQLQGINASPNEKSLPPEQQQRVRELADKMKEYGTVIWSTLRKMMDTVIRYTGNSLPENASAVVRDQVLSAPVRWQYIQSSPSEGRTYESTAARHIIAFSKEGLELMAQVTKVIGGTISSAELWLDRMGRRSTEEQGTLPMSEKDPNVPRQQTPSQPQHQLSAEKNGV